MQHQQKIVKAIGNILLVGSTGFFIYLAVPVITEELQYRNNVAAPLAPISNDFEIVIPSLGISSKIIENVNAWNKQEYLPALEHGVAHASGSATPNQNGSMFLFAHSSDVPWRMTRTNTAFFRLNRIKIGQEVVVDYQNTRYTYIVNEIKEVWPNEVEAVTQAQGDQLILQTCTPVGTSLKRLLVFAKKI